MVDYMRIYLDNCCFNRPYDDQSQLRIRLEAEAKLYIQSAVLLGKLELTWSYILDYENAANPFEEKSSAIEFWKNYAIVDITETPEILKMAEYIKEKGIKSKDALHIASAIAAKCDYFLTTDDSILRNLSSFEEIHVLDPIGFVRSTDL